MTVPVRAAWGIYFALLLAALLIPAFCSAEEPKRIGEAPTIVDWEKQTVTMSMELWKSIMLRIQSFDEYLAGDRGKLKREIEQELDKKHCI